MRGPGRDEKTVAQLLRVARARTDELQSHLANLEAAKASAEASLDWLAQAVREEESARGVEPAVIVDFQRFLEGAATKRNALEATRETLAAEIAAAREALGDAFAEFKKLEHLIEMNRRAAARRDRRAETQESDELVVMRRPRKGAA